MGKLGGEMRGGDIGEAAKFGAGAAKAATGNVVGGAKQMWKNKRVFFRIGGGAAAVTIALVLTVIAMLLALISQKDLQACQNWSGVSLADGQYVPIQPGEKTNMSVAIIAFKVAQQMHASDRMLLALFETALVESPEFRNVANDGVYGHSDTTGTPISATQAEFAGKSMQYPHDGTGSDHASVGFLQQQTPGWGSPEQLMNPAFATMKFLEKAQKLDQGSITAGQLAQKVQVSAYPDRYDQKQARALELLNHFGAAVSHGFYETDDESIVLGANASCLAGFVPGAKITLNNYGCTDPSARSITGNPCPEASKNTGKNRRRDYTFYLPREGPALLAIAKALEHVDNHVPYAYAGGNNEGIPTTGNCTKDGSWRCVGLDCSGLTYSAYVASGIGWKSRMYSYDQLPWLQRHGAIDVTNQEKLPGDLVFWTRHGESKTYHVALYLGREVIIKDGKETQGPDIIAAESTYGDHAKVQQLDDGGAILTWMRAFGTPAYPKPIPAGA